MPSSNSCLRCSKPLAVDSDSELCPVCLMASDTNGPRSRTPVSVIPQDGVGTISGVAIAQPDSHIGETDSLLVEGNIAGATADTISARTVGNASAHAAETASADISSAQPSTASNLELNFRAGLPSAPPGYDLLRRLGGGGMGDVFLAREHSTERVVAMKFLRASGNPTAVDRFLTEVRALAKIDHPHIIAVFATDFYSLTPFFTMEFLPGGTLSDRVAANGPMAPIQAARLMAIVARAVEVAHFADVLHRDLKPSNILLDSNGAPKVVDFGLAKRTDRDEELTIGSGPLGTPGFMPPEQVSKRHGAVGPSSDVYGLGATLYYLLSGRPPFMGDTQADIVSRVERDVPERLRAIRPDVPLELEAIVLKCLEKNPTHRYPSATALADDLDRFLVGQTPAAPQLTRWRRAQRWVFQQRLRIASVTVALAVVMGLLFAALARREQPVPAPEPPETKIDPVEEMQKELLAGHPVTLIGPTGLPKYWRSVFEPITIGPSPLGDQTCYFNAFQFALLELFPDPGLDHYRVDLELRRVWVKESTQGSGTDQVGFYFGYSSESSSGTEACHNMIAVTFKDYPMDGPNPNAPRAVFLQTLGVIQHPDKMPRDESGNFGSKEFLTNPAFGVPGIWRALSVEVSSNGALILWQSDKVVNGKKQMVPVGDGNGKKLAAEYERRKDSLELKSPGAKNLPQWHPRMPLGVLSFKSGISVRNVTITPLP